MKVGDIWNGQDSLIYNSVAKFVATDVDKIALEVDYIHSSATVPLILEQLEKHYY